MSSPRQDPQIQELVRLREVANQLTSEITGLEFRSERDWNSAEEEARLLAARGEFAGAESALREHLVMVRAEHADALAAYYSFEVRVAERELAKEPDDWFAQNMLDRWRRVAAGETDDIIFEQILGG